MLEYASPSTPLHSQPPLPRTGHSSLLYTTSDPLPPPRPFRAPLNATLYLSYLLLPTALRPRIPCRASNYLNAFTRAPNLRALPAGPTESPSARKTRGRRARLSGRPTAGKSAGSFYDRIDSRRERRVENFRQTVLARQSESRDSAFFKDLQKVLKRYHTFEPNIAQVVVPRTLRARMLWLCQDAAVSGAPGPELLRREYYWPNVPADATSTVRGCPTCAMNCLKLQRHLNRLRLLPATQPLEILAIEILGPLPQKKARKQFLLVITDCYTKLRQVVALRAVTGITVAVASCEAWLFKYGIPRSLLSDKSPQFNPTSFHSTWRVLGITNMYTLAYHPQTNGPV